MINLCFVINYLMLNILDFYSFLMNFISINQFKNFVFQFFTKIYHIDIEDDVLNTIKISQKPE